MAKSSPGRDDENGNEEGSSWTTRPVPKKRRTSAATLWRWRRRWEYNGGEGGGKILSDSNDRDKLEGARGNADPDLDQDSRGNKSLAMTLSDPDVLDCPICVEILSVPVFQVSSYPILYYCFWSCLA